MRHNFYSSDSVSLSASSTATAVAGPRSRDDKMIFYLAFRSRRRKRVLLVKVLAEDEETVRQLVSKLGGKGLHPHLVYSEPAPPSSEKVPNRLWCPYCREWRGLDANRAGYTVCEVCGVSDMDYHTRQYNRLWR